MTAGPVSPPIPNDASWRFRLPEALLKEFLAATPNASARLRYLIERDLKERQRKRRPTPPIAATSSPEPSL
jgi:hypothetical protein